MGRYNKFHAVKVKLDGMTFDSKKEAARYQELMLQQRAGEITDLKVHPWFMLQEKFEYMGVKYREIKYTADFQYTNKEGHRVIEDVKSPMTAKQPDYIMRKKLLLNLWKEKGKEWIFKET